MILDIRVPYHYFLFIIQILNSNILNPIDESEDKITPDTNPKFG